MPGQDTQTAQGSSAHAGASRNSGDALADRRPLPTLSAVASAGLLARFAIDPLSAGTQAVRKHGPLFACPPFPTRGRTTIVATGADFNREVLTAPDVWLTGDLPTGGPEGSALARIGQNLVSMNGPKHDHYRRIVAGPVRSAEVDRRGDEICDVLTFKVRTWSPGATDLSALCRDLMLTAAIRLLFSDEQIECGRLATLVSALFKNSRSIGVYLARAGLPLNHYRRLQTLAEDVEACAAGLASRRASAGYDGDLLSRLANAPDETGAHSCPTGIAGQIPILFAASYETCQSVLAWTLLLLASHPHAARRLADEITAAAHGSDLAFSKIGALPYLDAVVRESMRVLPPVPFQTRIAAADTSLDGHFVHRGAYVLISPFLTNRAPEVFDYPARFNPDRWCGAPVKPFAYMAFSAGPRVCPGAAFGMGLVKAALVSILSRFTIRIPAGARIDYRIAVTMAPRAGLPATLLSRNAHWEAAPLSGGVSRILDLTRTEVRPHRPA